MTAPTALVLETARRGEIHHAMILHGPSPDSLREMAMAISRALNCANRTTGDSCAVCQKIDRGLHPDVRIIDVAEEKKLISAEQIRDVVTGAALRPYEGRTKVFVIDPADAISTTGMNALLKTLEEPTADTVFILLTRSPDLLLPTIRSRSQSLYIGPANARKRDPGNVPLHTARIRERAWESGIDPDWATALASEILDCLDRCASRRETAALFRAAASIVSGDEKQGIAVYTAVLRDLAALPAEEMPEPAKARRIVAAIPRERLLAAADLAVRAIPRLVVNPDPRLLVEQSLIELAKK